jgi:predicted membrane protein
MEMQKEDATEPTADITITDADGNEKPISIRKHKINKIIGQGFRFYNHHYTIIFMLTLPFFLMTTRVWYGKNNRKRYFRAEYLVAITYSMVMVVIYRCLVSLVYLFSPDVSGSMSEWVFLVIVAAFTACFHKMLGFSIPKTAWRSLLAVVLYYIIMLFVLIFGCIVAYFIFRKRILVGS